MKRIILLIMMLFCIGVFQIIISIYLNGVHLDLFGLTILAIWIHSPKMKMLAVFALSMIADMVGQYYLGTHLLLFTFIMLSISKYSLYLCLCNKIKRITSLQVIGMAYYLALSILNFGLQHVIPDIRSLFLTFIIMPMVYYYVCNICEDESFY